jgi:hypothetical protein
MDLNNEENYFLFSGYNLSLMIFHENSNLSINLPIDMDPIYYSV